MDILKKCKKCGGTGYLINLGMLFRCDKCLGCGELDWVENVVGIKRDREVPTTDQLIKKYNKEVWGREYENKH